jgi:hypothetical protein
MNTDFGGLLIREKYRHRFNELISQGHNTRSAKRLMKREGQKRKRTIR